MLIALTSEGKSLEGPVSRRFGKSPFIFVADTETRVVRIIDNGAFACLHLGSGAKTAEMLERLGVSWVATGAIGQEAWEILDNGGIKVATCATGTCREVLDRLAAGGLTPAAAPAPCRPGETED